MPEIARRIPLLLALCGLLLPAGCGTNPYPAAESGQSVMYRAIFGEVRTLDPSNSYTLTEAAITDLVYPSYFQYHYLKQKPFTLELALGAREPVREKWPLAAGRMGERWTFTLKRGLRFQDDPCFPGGRGREVRAADVLTAFRRLADPRLEPPSPVLSFFDDKVIGLADYKKLLAEKKAKQEPITLQEPVEGLQLSREDPDYTFHVILNQPYPQLRYLMAMHFTTPIPVEAVDYWNGVARRDLRHHMVGCGPFRMVEYAPKRRLVLERNPNARPETYPTEGDPEDEEAGLLEDAGKPLPLVDRIVYSFHRERLTIWNLFLQGYLDQWQVTQDNYSQVVSKGAITPEMAAKGIQLRKVQQPNVRYFAFNMTDPVVGGLQPRKRKLRQAISLAIDAPELIDLYFQGIGTPAESIVPPGLFGYEPDYRNPYRQTNLTRAKQLLADAGYPGGIDPATGDRLVIYYDNAATSPEDRQFVGLVTRQVERLGIRLQSRTWRDTVWQDKVDRGEFQFVFYGWYADYPDPENFVFLLYGPNRRPGPNHASYENPEYDRIFEQMRAMDDGPERLELIRRLRAIAEEDCPWVFLTHDEDMLLNYDWLSNVKPHGVANDLAKYRGVDVERRTAFQKRWNQPNYWPLLAAILVLVGGSVPAARVVRAHSRRKQRRRG